MSPGKSCSRFQLIGPAGPVNGDDQEIAEHTTKTIWHYKLQAASIDCKSSGIQPPDVWHSSARIFLKHAAMSSAIFADVFLDMRQHSLMPFIHPSIHPFIHSFIHSRFLTAYSFLGPTRNATSMVLHQGCLICSILQKPILISWISHKSQDESAEFTL